MNFESMKKNNTAAFIAGDKGIISSSYVVFKSLIEHNDGIDCFICLPKGSYSNEEASNLKTLGVNFLDLEEDTLFSDCISWPKEAFLNYSIPNKLYELGYQMAIKLDNDLLINGNLNINDNFPKKYFLKTTVHNYDTFEDMFITHKDFYKNEFLISDEKLKNKTITQGCLYINLEKYVNYKVWEKYKNIYKNIITKSPDKSNQSIFADMGILALVLYHYKLDYEILDDKYNYIVSSIKHLKNKESLDLSPIVIHYAGPKKPWKKTKLLKYITNPYNIYYRQKWLDYTNSNKNKGFKSKIINSSIYKLYLKIFIKILVR